jgi:hypothetical protein
MPASQSTMVPATSGSPGAKVSRDQAELLYKKEFVAVLGADIVDTWPVDWVLWENPEICPTDPLKAKVMRTLLDHLYFVVFNHSNDAVSKLLQDLLDLKNAVYGLSKQRLIAATGDALRSHFPVLKMEFYPKRNGVQLGAQVRLFLDSGESRLYHVKTHAAGTVSSNSSAAKPVDSGELLVYKILEMTGCGCESLFFQRNVIDSYIATLDAGHGGSFDLFRKAAGSGHFRGDDVYGKTLWGCLDMIDPIPHLNNWDSVEAAVHDDATAQRFLSDLASLDMISRIFRLHDLLNNSDNFGFRTSAPGQFVLKIVDFRLANDSDLGVTGENFAGFLAGNGFYNYVASHRILRYALRDRPVRQRVQEALRALQAGFLSKLPECIDSAFECVQEHLKSLEMSIQGERMHLMIGRLVELRDTFHHNVRYFTNRLQTWPS